MPLTGTLKALISLSETKVIDLGSAAFPIAKEYSWKITSGTGVDQADLVFSDQRTLGAGANEDLDLAAALTSVYGASLTYARIKALLIKAAAANPNNLTLSRPASNGVPLFAAAGDAIIIRPGGVFAWWAPDATAIAVTAGTGDLLNLLAGAGGNHVYDVVIIGASA
jgi:hypothetical protein